MPYKFKKSKQNGKNAKVIHDFKNYAQRKYFRALRKLDGRKRDKKTGHSTIGIKGKKKLLTNFQRKNFRFEAQSRYPNSKDLLPY